jgi:hypothetical protein
MAETPFPPRRVVFIGIHVVSVTVVPPVTHATAPDRPRCWRVADEREEMRGTFCDVLPIEPTFGWARHEIWTI